MTRALLVTATALNLGYCLAFAATGRVKQSLICLAFSATTAALYFVHRHYV